jgi:hypothetical protein
VADSSKLSSSAGTLLILTSTVIIALRIALLFLRAAFNCTERRVKALFFAVTHFDSIFCKMPFKRVARRPDENADDEKNMREAKNRFPLPYYVIIISVVLFALNVGYGTYEDMVSTFSVTEGQSKTCILDFQKNSCNPLNLTEPCEKILDCVQKENS